MTKRGEDRLEGWGRLAVAGREVRSEDLAAVARGAVLCRGLGRSYGDSALPPPGVTEVAGSTLADRILGFDAASGILRAEAGVSLLTLNRLLLPRGWSVPVSPGTQYVTLGGIVAADVHGKNHHRSGTIGRHVTALKLMLASGETLECGPEREPELYRATLGGMGLTGHILEVELRMERIPSAWIFAEGRRCASLEELVAALDAAAAEWPFTAAWLDGLGRGRRLGRGILLCGRWAGRKEAPARPPVPRRPLQVPLDAPGGLLNRWSVGLFNAFYYRLRLRDRWRGIVHPEAFFYPLDGVRDWNRLYGRRGLTQYQCVLPREGGDGVARLRRLLERVHELGGTPFLAVLKDFGPEGAGLLSFPRAGHTLALDFPVGSGTQRLVDGLNEFVLAAGGRVYLAKDAFTRPKHFRRMEPRLAAFLAARRCFDPEGRIRSRQSARLMDPSAAAAEGEEPEVANREAAQ